jgi:hypothetical protein
VPLAEDSALSSSNGNGSSSLPYSFDVSPTALMLLAPLVLLVLLFEFCAFEAMDESIKLLSAAKKLNLKNILNLSFSSNKIKQKQK